MTYMGPNWVLSAPVGLHVGPMNLAIRGVLSPCFISVWPLHGTVWHDCTQHSNGNCITVFKSWNHKWHPISYSCWDTSCLSFVWIFSVNWLCYYTKPSGICHVPCIFHHCVATMRAHSISGLSHWFPHRLGKTKHFHQRNNLLKFTSVATKLP